MPARQMRQRFLLDGAVDSSPRDGFYPAVIHSAVDTIESLASAIFGLFAREQHRDLSVDLQALLDERQAARAAKDFKRSDDLRDALRQKGVAVEDTKDGQTWRWL